MNRWTLALFPLAFACTPVDDTDDVDSDDTDVDGDDTDAGNDDTDPDTDDTDTGNAEIEIAGSYQDDFGGTHDITAETWTQGGFGGDPLVFHFVTVDNDANFATAQNDPANAFNPSLYSRFDWVEADTTLYYCQTVFDAATEEAAAAATAADPSDPATSGCGGFAWSKLTPL